MPTDHDGSPLEAALSFYSSIVTVNPEGDSLVSDETLDGLGTTGFLLQALFGSLLRLANPDPVYPPLHLPDATQLPAPGPSHHPITHSDQLQGFPANMVASAAAVPAVRYGPAATVAAPPALTETAAAPPIPQYEGIEHGISDLIEEDPEGITTRLTDLLPEPGYFLAGAVSGGVSRTATAPLDRLKVYLLVNTKNANNAALEAAKRGRPLAALRNAGGPIIDAIVSLWKAGGVRTFFAGKSMPGRRLCWTCADCVAGNGLNVVKIMPESAIRVSIVQIMDGDVQDGWGGS